MTTHRNKIDKKNIENFFKERARKHSKHEPLKTVIYQDKNPILARKRDEYEKNKIRSLINFSNDDIVLDIGCGIGRWADEISGIVKKYIGVDYINAFINIANSKFKKNKNISFICLDSTKLLNLEVKLNGPYSIFLIVGLFLYIDDEEV